MADTTTNPSPVPSIITSVLRGVLISAGTYLVTKGYISAEGLSSAVGAILVVIPIAWGAWQKVHANNKLKDAIDAPAGKAVPK